MNALFGFPEIPTSFKTQFYFLAMAQRCLPFELLLSVMFLQQEFSFPK